MVGAFVREPGDQFTDGEVRSSGRAAMSREQGYQRFNLGMAPLSGLQVSPLPTLWDRVGRLVFRYGENFFNFQGLRRFKEKFDPQWQPRYLACRGGIALPRGHQDSLKSFDTNVL